MEKTKLVSRRIYNNRKAQFRAAQAPATVKNSPTNIENKNILNWRVRNRQFKIKELIPQLKNVQVNQRGNVVRKMFVRRKTIYPGKLNVQF